MFFHKQNQFLNKQPKTSSIHQTTNPPLYPCIKQSMHHSTLAPASHLFHIAHHRSDVKSLELGVHGVKTSNKVLQKQVKCLGKADQLPCLHSEGSYLEEGHMLLLQGDRSQQFNFPVLYYFLFSFIIRFILSTKNSHSHGERIEHDIKCSNTTKVHLSSSVLNQPTSRAFQAWVCVQRLVWKVGVKAGFWIEVRRVEDGRKWIRMIRRRLVNRIVGWKKLAG